MVVPNTATMMVMVLWSKVRCGSTRSWITAVHSTLTMNTTAT